MFTIGDLELDRVANMEVLLVRREHSELAGIGATICEAECDGLLVRGLEVKFLVFARNADDSVKDVGRHRRLG